MTARVVCNCGAADAVALLLDDGGLNLAQAIDPTAADRDNCAQGMG